MYINDVDSFTLRYCYSHNAVAGHELKSRAKTNYILYNRIGNEGGTGSYEVQIANGGTSLHHRQPDRTEFDYGQRDDY